MKTLADNFDVSRLLLESSELVSKIWFTFLILCLYRFGTYVPLSGIDAEVLVSLNDVHSGGILGVFNMFTGGALGRMSILALNIMPFITASIIIQLMTSVIKHLENLKKEGEKGRQSITQYTRYLTIAIALFQSYGIAIGAENITSHLNEALVPEPGFFFRFITMLNLTAGTVFVMYLGEQISSRGIGNGSSLIIFIGIISGFPSALISFLEMGRTGSISTFLLLSIILLMLGLVYIIVLFEKSQRRIPIQYPKRQVGQKIYQGASSYLPLKINTAGVIPPIFASALLLFPMTVLNFYSSANSSWALFFANNFSHGKPLYILAYFLLIIFFCFFYTSIIFNPKETSENLKNHGAVIPGQRPGKNTSDYLESILNRLTLIGAFYIALVCVVPEILVARYSFPFYLGGTSLLIVVSVVLDLRSQIQNYFMGVQYQSLMKKNRLNFNKRYRK